MERRELALRQRFEAIYEKMTDTRNLLSRVEFDDTTRIREDRSRRTLQQPRCRANRAPTASPPQRPERAAVAHALRVAGSLQNVVQSADEMPASPRRSTICATN